MTKRIVLFLAVVLTAVVVYAEDFTVNGIKYTGDETTKTATVTGTEDGFNQTDVVIPETVNGYTVTRIGVGAFWQSGLKSLHIPASVTEIEYSDIYGWPFTGCGRLESITVDAGNSVFDSRNNCNAIIETANNNLLLGCRATVIPDDIVSIGKRAFEEMYYQANIHIPSSVKTIGERAFYMCGLKSIDIPNSVTSIKPYAFALNDSLTAFTLPESITEIEEGVFCQDQSLVSVTNLPSSLLRIGASAFWRCRYLETIIIPESVTNIDDRAFQGCHRLHTITIPASVTYIGEEYTFGDCELQSIAVDKANKVYDSREDCNAIIRTADNTLLFGASSSFIPNSVTAIGPSAFSRRKNLESITIPAGVTSIGYNAFSGCDQLNTVTSLIQEPFEVQPRLGLANSSDNDLTLYVPKGCVNKYKATEGWNWFEFIREIGDTSEGYLWTADYERGGKAEATDGVSVGYENAGYTTIRLNGKTKWNDGNYVTVRLEKPLHAGDKISITAYRNKNAANKKSGVRMELCGEAISGTVTLASSTGLEFVNIDQSSASANDSNRGTEPNTCEFEVPAKADGCTWFYMTRSHTETNLFITRIEIGESKTQGDVNGDGVVDVADIATVISVMASVGADSVSARNADVNHDGVVDVADIATIISIMAGK